MKSFLFCLFLFVQLFSFAQADPKVTIVSITPSENTGQDYSSWLSDDLNQLVPNYWQPSNNKWVDVKLQLATKSLISMLSFYDYEGIFTDAPAVIYALNGAQQTYLGKFTGEYYMHWVDLNLSAPIVADAIIIHKFRNNIPQKIKIFGQPYSEQETVKIQSVINFTSLPASKAGDASFILQANSNNAQMPITFTSSNPEVISVSAQNGVWKASPLTAGTATITANQEGNVGYLAAAPVSQTITIQSATVVSPLTTGKIPVDKKRWHQLNNTSNGLDGLFDSVTNVKVETGWGKLLSNYDAWYPVLPGESMTLSGVKFFDWEGTNSHQPMTLSVVNSKGERIPIAVFKGEHYNRWVGPDSNQPDNFNLPKPITDVKYLVINSWSIFPTEIELYGRYTAPKPFTPVTKASVPFRQQLGVNAFEWNFEDPYRPYEIDEQRMKAAKSFTGIRHYIDWEKLETQQGSYTFNPTHSGGWNYDAIYERCKKEGIDVLACLKTIPGWMQNSYPSTERDYENVPVLYGKDFSDPRSYLEQAKVAFQFVARYGSNPGVNRSLLSVNTTPRWYGDGINEVKVGLGLIKYIECDNERDKWWKGRKAYQTAYEYAANLSAFYDGHKGSMGPGVGVKNADPNMLVVMGGLAAPTTEYLRGMIEWCRQNRGYKADGSIDLCWDVINYHYYSNNASSSQGGNSNRGAAPEVSGTAATAAEFIEIAHQYAQDMPVWITEAGYDVNQGSPFRAIPIGNKSAEQTQADWVLRTALLYARAGVQRTFFYQMYDDKLWSDEQFNSMGFIRVDKTRKPAADFLLQANRLLGEYSYRETLQQDPLVDRFEYNGQSIYSLTIPDENGRTASYTLNLGTDSAYVYTPKTSHDTMELTRVKTENGSIKLSVTETPIFVKGVSPVANSQSMRKTEAMENLPVHTENSVNVYPNPMNDVVFISLQNKYTGKIDVRIIESGSGRLQKSVSFQKKGEQFNQVINIQSLPAGLYLVEINQGGNLMTRKIVKLQ